MHHSRLPYFFLGLAAVLAASALVLLILRPGVKPAPSPLPAVSDSARVAPPPHANTEPPTQPATPLTPAPNTTDPALKKPTDPAAKPADLVNQVATALSAGDLPALERLLGKDAMDPQTAELLKALTAAGVRLRPQDGIREVGEIGSDNHTRWALELAGAEPGRDRIFLDLRHDGKKWVVEKITLPPTPGEPIPKAVLADPLGVADAFLQATLRQDFEFARAFVDPATVSDAKIAGLCIMFEEGGYRLRKSKPLRAMFQQPDTAGFLANVETADGSQAGQLSLTLKQPSAPANWLVTEINLDQLLGDYARRVAGGDVYYSPLVKNPAGGDTLALYFEFDADQMNRRTCRQLEIVSRILQADPGKKLTLSGHTDSMGSDSYNDRLSLRRADAVRDFLVKAGVSSAQILTVAEGARQPRRPNVTETGQDNPQGRRANRRTEIYLDF